MKPLVDPRFQRVASVAEGVQHRDLQGVGLGRGGRRQGREGQLQQVVRFAKGNAKDEVNQATRCHNSGGLAPPF